MGSPGAFTSVMTHVGKDRVCSVHIHSPPLALKCAEGIRPSLNEKLFFFLKASLDGFYYTSSSFLST